MSKLRLKFALGIVASVAGLIASGGSGDQATGICFSLLGAALIVADAVDGGTKKV